MLRIEGELGLLFEASTKEAEASFARALEVARKQHARSFELRAATSLAGVWYKKGNLIRARDLLAPIYGWFTEGFDTRDLKGARALNPGMGARVRETKSAADQSHVLLHSVGPRNLEELDAAFTDLLKARPDALLVTAEPFTRRYLARIVEFSTTNRIPSMFEDKVYVTSGGLMSYGPDYDDVFQKAAIFVDKILKGAKPADLPIEQPTKFELVINAKTANAIGIQVPDRVLALADKVVE